MDIQSELINKLDLTVFGEGYKFDEVILIPNMLQNAKYIKSDITNGQLVDVFVGEDDRLIFVWKKSPQIKEAFDLWCKRKL